MYGFLVRWRTRRCENSQKEGLIFNGMTIKKEASNLASFVVAVAHRGIEPLFQE